MTPLDYSVRPTPAAGPDRRFRSTIVDPDQCGDVALPVLLNSGRSVRQLLQLGTEPRGMTAALFAIKVLRAVNGDRRTLGTLVGVGPREDQKYNCRCDKQR